MSGDLYQLITAELAGHRPWMSWGEVPEGLYCGGCERRYPRDEFDAHVGRLVGDLLIDLAGTGQLLASINRIARFTEPEVES